MNGTVKCSPPVCNCRITYWCQEVCEINWVHVEDRFIAHVCRRVARILLGQRGFLRIKGKKGPKGGRFFKDEDKPCKKFQKIQLRDEGRGRPPPPPLATACVCILDYRISGGSFKFPRVHYTLQKCSFSLNNILLIVNQIVNQYNNLKKQKLDNKDQHMKEWKKLPSF